MTGRGRCSLEPISAPDLVRAALAVGITVGWDEHGAAFALMTNRDDERQQCIFKKLMASREAGDVLFGWYYPGDWERMQ